MPVVRQSNYLMGISQSEKNTRQESANQGKTYARVQPIREMYRLGLSLSAPSKDSYSANQSKEQDRVQPISHLLLLLNRFSHVGLCETPQMAAHQAPPSLGFSRQEQWSRLPFPSPMMKVKSEREVAQSCPTLSDPMDCSLPGSSAHGIFQARVLEWGAITFSKQSSSQTIIQ